MTKKKNFFDKLLDFGTLKVEEVVKNYIQEKVTNKLIKVGEVSLAFLVGLLCVIVGITQFIAYQLSFLENGLNYIVMGSVLLFVAYFLSK